MRERIDWFFFLFDELIIVLRLYANEGLIAITAYVTSHSQRFDYNVTRLCYSISNTRKIVLWKINRSDEQCGTQQLCFSTGFIMQLRSCVWVKPWTAQPQIYLPRCTFNTLFLRCTDEPAPRVSDSFSALKRQIPYGSCKWNDSRFSHKRVRALDAWHFSGASECKSNAIATAQVVDSKCLMAFNCPDR